MNKDPFSMREDEIFQTLKALKNQDFTVIGGYAVNAYALPRFSVDCDIVIKDESELKKIALVLTRLDYKKEALPEDAQYSGSFSRYEKQLENGFLVSMDILIKTVVDRQTGVSFLAEWIFKNSQKRTLRGKTITEELKVRIIDADALLVMKMISARSTDIRDVFMMLPNAKDKSWIKNEISIRHDVSERVNKIIEKVSSKQFKDGLAGVYGQIDAKTFEKHKKAILEFLK